MKMIIATLIFLLALLPTFPGSAEPPQVLRMVSNQWEPYTGDGLLNKGVSSDIVATALRRAGYEVEITIVPWTRALKGVEAGKYHGLLTAWFSSERAQYMAYGEHYMTNDVVLFKRKADTISFSTLQDLEKFQIGVIRDYAYGEEFNASTKLMKKPALDLRTNIVRLSKGIIDLFPEDRLVMLHFLNTNYPEYKTQFVALDKPLSKRTLHMTISRKTPGYRKIVADFNQELAAMKAEGLFDMMLEKHSLAEQ